MVDIENYFSDHLESSMYIHILYIYRIHKNQHIQLQIIIKMKLILIDGYEKLISSLELVIKYKLMRDSDTRKMYDLKNLKLLRLKEVFVFQSRQSSTYKFRFNPWTCLVFLLSLVEPCMQIAYE